MAEANRSSTRTLQSSLRWLQHHRLLAKYKKVERIDHRTITSWCQRKIRTSKERLAIRTVKNWEAYEPFRKLEKQSPTANQVAGQNSQEHITMASTDKSTTPGEDNESGESDEEDAESDVQDGDSDEKEEENDDDMEGGEFEPEHATAEISVLPVQTEDAARTFTCFSKLPVELRCMVWKHTLPGRR